jgi:hypothetical protein
MAFHLPAYQHNPSAENWETHTQEQQNSASEFWQIPPIWELC